LLDCLLSGNSASGLHKVSQLIASSLAPSLGWPPTRLLCGSLCLWNSQKDIGCIAQLLGRFKQSFGLLLHRLSLPFEFGGQCHIGWMHRLLLLSPNILRAPRD
jgi:hypothetical protein